MNFKTLIFFFFIFGAFYSKAQKEYNMWYFGDHAGLNFNTNPPSVLTDSKTKTYESSTSICDKNGNLLFYTNGDSIYNRKHELMNNGKMSNSKGRSSAMQGSLALQVPGSNNLYYLILGRQSETAHWHPIDSLRYCIIDMQLDNGFGEVIEKEVALLPNPLESFATTLHANGKDYWIGATDYSAGNFNLIKTINGKFDSKHIQHKLPLFSPYIIYLDKKIC